MSGTYPTTPKPSSIDVSSIEPNFVSVSSNLKRQVRSRGAQRWAFRVNYPPMKRDEFAPIYSFSLQQRGQYETFNWVPEVIGVTQGIKTESPVVDGAVAIGLRTCSIDGLTASTNNILKAGDFIKFSGHSKIYMVTSDVNSDGSGDATLNFSPALSTAVANNETITINNVPFVVAFNTDLTSYNIGLSDFCSYSIELIEVP